MEDNKSSDIIPVTNENTEKDVNIQDVVQQEDTEQVAQIEENIDIVENVQQGAVEEADKNSSTCEANTKLSASNTVDVDVFASDAPNTKPSVTEDVLSQVESMEQETLVESKETFRTVVPISHEEIIADESNENHLTNEVSSIVEAIDASASKAIEAPVLTKADTDRKTMDVTGHPQVAVQQIPIGIQLTNQEAPVLNITETKAASGQEQINVTRQPEEVIQQIPIDIQESTEANMVAKDVSLNEFEKTIEEKTANFTAADDVPQIIENLILVKSFTEQPSLHLIEAVNESQAPTVAHCDLETPMETNECTKFENTSQILELPSITVASSISQTFKTPITPAAQSGLSMLAQYDSDDEDDSVEEVDSDDVIVNHPDNEIERISDTESVVEVPTTNRDYRSRVVDIDSDSETDSSDSDVASEVSYLSEIRKAIDKSIDVDADVDADAADEDEFDDNGSRTKRQPPRVKGEFLIDDLPPIQDLHITVPEAECVELGKVHSIVDQLVLVNALPNSLLLDLETVLFLDKGQRVLGEVFDVLGQVADPLYCVRFNSNKQILEKNITIGDLVFVAPKTQYTQFVILSSLMKMRGSDASWENDVEPPPRYLDYSDDEQERDARARLRNRDRSTDHWDPSKRARSDLEISSPSPSISPSPFPRNPFQQMRPRGGRGGFRPPRYQHPSQEYHQRPNYNAGSWHSNYPQPYAVPPQNFASVVPPHLMYAQPPPPNFAVYSPQAVSMQSYPVAQPNLQQPPPQVYVLNPYAVRPPVLAHNSPQAPMYQRVLPPPPPPGNI